jgi:Holliday junction resolvase RusA-like endonuclease
VYNPSSPDIAAFALKTRPFAPHAISPGPVSVFLEFVFGRPVSHFTSRALRAGAPVQHLSKPDTDNLVKFVLDALTGNFYNDDAQVHKLEAIKRYADQDEEACTRVTVIYGYTDACPVALASC